MVNQQVEKRKANKFLFTSIGIFSIVLFIALSILGYTFFLHSTLASLQKEEDDLKAQLAQNNDKKANILVLKERLSNIQKVMSSRTDINKKVSAILGIFPQDVSISNVQASSDKITFTLVSDNLEAIDQLIENKIKAFTINKTLPVKKIDLVSFNLNPKSGYNLFFAFEFSK